MPLSAADRGIVQSLRRDDVRTTLEGLKPFVSDSNWIGKRNRYAKNVVKKIRNELAAAGIVRPKELSQYIAASMILHCGDGWSYLGRAVSALLRGDPHRARHLAYYAELRAAMSLLASIGVGVFRSQHFAISRPNAATFIGNGRPTHQFVWECLELWGNLNSSGDLFSRVVRPDGINLSDWLAPVGGTPSVAAQARAWFLQWGMDIRDSASDQFARNESSYRPDGLRSPWQVNATDVLTFVTDFWVSMEPSAACRFEGVDGHVLRVAIESAFQGRTGRSRRQSPAAFRALVGSIVDSQSLSDSARNRWVRFLCREVSPDDIAIMKYSKVDPSVAHKSHFSVFARAALLLRVASGSALELLSEAGIVADDMIFWWGTLGRSRGLWDGDRATGTIMDLWADVQPDLQNIQRYQASVGPEHQTFFQAGNQIVSEMVGLGCTERIAVWSLTP